MKTVSLSQVGPEDLALPPRVQEALGRSIPSPSSLPALPAPVMAWLFCDL